MRVFYAANCTYWTDDFSKLQTTGSGIPCCPHCKSVGFETDLDNWWGSALAYQMNEAPGYVDFLKLAKETCFGNTKLGMLQAYKVWNTTKNKLTDDVRLLAEHHMGDNDELGVAARRILL